MWKQVWYNEYEGSRSHPSKESAIDTQDTYYRQRAVVEREDVEQEAALLVLEGKVPNRAIIRRRLAGQQRSLLSPEFPDDAVPIQYMVSTPLPTEDTIEQLVDWALEQVAPIQDQFWIFLEDPEAHLEATLELLAQHQAIYSPTETKSVSVKSILLAALPATKEQLYALARSLLDTERPEATVRQFLRRGHRNGYLETEPLTGRITCSGPSNDAPDR